MIKFKQGGITNPLTGEYKDIIVKAAAPNNLKDILIGGSMVLMGIDGYYLSYRNCIQEWI